MNRPATLIRAVHTADFDQWLPLWEGYNAFYGRIGVTSLDDAITRQTWERFFIESDPVQAFVAEIDGELVGLVHIVFHPSTSRKNDVCYLQDLFTSAEVRGRGVGRALIERCMRRRKRERAPGCTGRRMRTIRPHEHFMTASPNTAALSCT